MKPSGIEPATFRIVLRCPNQLRYGVPHSYCYVYVFLLNVPF